MREIKYRAKTYEDRFYPDLAPSKWVSGFLVMFPNEFVWMHTSPNNRVIVQPETIGQFTGLCDYDGKEIFEGDIVKCCYMIPNWGWSGGAEEQEEEIIGAVEYRRGDFCIGEYPIVSFQSDEMEVVGNIYDNPELLKTL